MCLALPEAGCASAHAGAACVADTLGHGGEGLAASGVDRTPALAGAGLGQDGNQGADTSGHGPGLGSPGSGAPGLGQTVARSPGRRVPAGQDGADMGRVRGVPKGSKRVGHNTVVVPAARHGFGARAALQALLSDANTTGQARASAARTLAEMDGLIGRHQSSPDRAADIPVEELTRADLVTELARLRARCAPPPG